MRRLRGVVHFIRLAQQERDMRREEGIRPHTPDVDHFGRSNCVSLPDVVRLLSHEPARARILKITRTPPYTGEQLASSLEATERERDRLMAQRRHAGWHVELRYWRLANIRRAGYFNQFIASPWGIVYHAKYISRNGRLKYPPWFRHNVHLRMHNGNHRLLGAALVGGWDLRVEALMLSRRDTRNALFED